jgi:two-component system nitrogen regulation response regulator GlnG
MSRVLIVDDEESICWAFREFLGDQGHHVEIASTAEDGLKIAGASPLDTVVLDVRLPGMDGLAALSRFRDLVGPAPIIVITAFGNLDTAVQAMEGGAFDYLVKPFDLDQAVAVVGRALESKRSRLATGEDRNSASDEHASAGRVAADDPSVLIGHSQVMQELYKQIALVAPTDVPVLVTGESGTGKELVARAIHRHSTRGRRAFLPVCLAALSPGLIEGELFGHQRGAFTGATVDRKGLLELADGGTVLLDEVGDVPAPAQVKLLRAIEHREITPVGDARPKPVNVRFLAATNRPLDALIASGAFREDLFFRLSVFPIHVPPLRDRREDIPELAARFLAQVTRASDDQVSLRDDVARELMARPWSGNVRELRNAIERAAIIARGRDIRIEHLPPPARADLASGSNPQDRLRSQIVTWIEAEMRNLSTSSATDPTLYDRVLALIEPPLLESALRQNQGNRALAARQIGIHRATLRQKLHKYGLE